MCTSLTREAGVPFPLIRDTMSRESVLSSSLSVSRQSNRVRGLPSNHVPYRLKPTGLSTDRSSKSSFTMNTSGINLDSLESASIQMLIAWIDQLVQDRLTHLTNPSKVDIEEFQATEQALYRIRNHMLEGKLLQGEQMGSKRDIQLKLDLIDKLMAETSVQAQSLRDKYYNLVNCRTTASKCFGANRASQTLKGLMSRSSIHLTETIQSPKVSIIRQSSYAAGYSSPKKSLIQLFKQPERKFAYSRTPVVSSHYSLNYRNKENTPAFPAKKQREHFNVSKQYCPQRLSESAYISDYTRKEPIPCMNYKELDCFKNKIRTMKINFSQNKSQNIPLNTLAKLEQEYSNIRKRPPFLAQSKSTQNQFATTNNRDYTGIFTPKAVGKYDQFKKLKRNYQKLLSLSKSKSRNSNSFK